MGFGFDFVKARTEDTAYIRDGDKGIRINIMHNLQNH